MKSKKSETNNNTQQTPKGFKQTPKGWQATDIGLIPEDWEVLNISEVSKFSRGTSWRKSEEAPDGVLVISIPNIKDGSIDFESKFNHYIKKRITENKKLEVGDIIFVGSSGSLHNVGRNTIINYLPFEPIAFASFTFKAKVNNKKIDNRFFYHLVNSSLVDLQKYTKRAADGKFNFQLQEFQRTAKIPYMSLPEQKKIAHVLSKIQQAIEGQEKIIKTTQELKKALMQKLFTEGLNGEPQKMTEIGPIPESWEVKRIDEVYVFTKKPRQRNLTNYKNIPFIPMELIPDSGIEANTFIPKNYSDIPSGTYFENGDLLLAKITPSFENGKQGIADINFIFGYATTEVIPIQQKKDLSDIHYLFYYLLKEDVRKTLAGKMEGSTGRQRLSKGVVQSTLIPFPKLAVQQKISSIFSEIEYKIQIDKSKTKNLQELFKNALNLLMTGQIRVKDIEFELEENINTPRVGKLTP